MPGQSTKTTLLTLRVPNELLEELRREAKKRRISVAAVIIERLTSAAKKERTRS